MNATMIVDDIIKIVEENNSTKEFILTLNNIKECFEKYYSEAFKSEDSHTKFVEDNKDEFYDTLTTSKTFLVKNYKSIRDILQIDHIHHASYIAFKVSYEMLITMIRNVIDTFDEIQTSDYDILEEE